MVSFPVHRDHDVQQKPSIHVEKVVSIARFFVHGPSARTSGDVTYGDGGDATRETHDRDVYSARTARDSKMDLPSSIDHSRNLCIV